MWCFSETPFYVHIETREFVFKLKTWYWRPFSGNQTFFLNLLVYLVSRRLFIDTRVKFPFFSSKGPCFLKYGHLVMGARINLKIRTFLIFYSQVFGYLAILSAAWSKLWCNFSVSDSRTQKRRCGISISSMAIFFAATSSFLNIEKPPAIFSKWPFFEHFLTSTISSRHSIGSVRVHGITAGQLNCIVRLLVELTTYSLLKNIPVLINGDFVPHCFLLSCSTLATQTELAAMQPYL